MTLNQRPLSASILDSEDGWNGKDPVFNEENGGSDNLPEQIGMLWTVGSPKPQGFGSGDQQNQQDLSLFSHNNQLNPTEDYDSGNSIIQLN
jgi:hypothetical protein